MFTIILKIHRETALLILPRSIDSVNGDLLVQLLVHRVPHRQEHSAVWTGRREEEYRNACARFERLFELVVCELDLLGYEIRRTASHTVEHVEDAERSASATALLCYAHNST